MSTLFASVVVGTDGTPSSLAALAQARRLAASDARLVAVAVAEEHLAAHAGAKAPAVAADLHADAEAAAARARELTAGMPGAEAVVVKGRAIETLHRVAEERGADLIAVGNHGHGRIATILIGSVSGEVLHDATQSVLVARPGDSDALARVVVGVDGSPVAAAALERARAIAAAAAVPLRIVSAGGGKGVDAAAIAAIEGVEHVSAGPVDALLQGAGPDDLIVVGSRGLHGVKALGSVSERVAHKAPCSVLVVRGG